MREGGAQGMRVVVIEERKAERDSLVRALQGGRFLVEACSDQHVGLAAMHRDAPDVVVLGWGASVRETVRLFRESDGARKSYLVAVLDAGSRTREIDAAKTAGLHDFLIRPLVNDELVARVEAPLRLRRWAMGLAEIGQPPASVTDRLRAWGKMGDSVSEDLASLLDRPARATPGWPDGFEGALRGATIAMSLASERKQFRITIVADERSLRGLSEVLLADPRADRAALDDVLRELANTAGAALKRTALDEGATLITGLPMTDANVRPRREGHCWTITFSEGLGTLAVVGETRALEPQQVTAGSLREGMILVSEIRPGGGTLLVTAGTRVTSTIAQRVVDCLGKHVVVDVAEVA